VVQAAIDEDVDVIGLSILSGAHMTVFPRVLEMLRGRGVPDIKVVGGGVIPYGDIAELERLGVTRLFTPGTPTGEIVAFIQSL
jgi:methylmalonyl-CoA mutase C-terminal domain/subunit